VAKSQRVPKTASKRKNARRLNDAPPQRITKIAAAERQLVTAVDLFFRNGDSVVIYALAGAAREIITTMCEMRGIKPFFDDAQNANPQFTQKQLQKWPIAIAGFSSTPTRIMTLCWKISPTPKTKPFSLSHVMTSAAYVAAWRSKCRSMKPGFSPVSLYALVRQLTAPS